MTHVVGAKWALWSLFVDTGAPIAGGFGLHYSAAAGI